MQTVYKVPVNAYDIATGELVPADRYLHDQPMDVDLWQNQMLKAQKAGRRIVYSNEWSGIQRYEKSKNPDFEARFVDTVAWTGTVLDFGDETLKEGITLNGDGTIAEAEVVLGRKDKIVLPYENRCVKDLPEDCMPLISYLHGVKDPKRELPDCACIWVTPVGLRNVVRRGDWAWHDDDGRRVAVLTRYVPTDCRFAAWLVDEKLSENMVTRAAYERVEGVIADKKAELALLRKMLSFAVLVE